MPKFRVPAALVSPASLFLVGGIIYYFSLDKPSEDELNNNIGREFPDVRIGRGRGAILDTACWSQGVAIYISLRVSF